MKKKLPPMTRRWGMAIDLDLCTGCGACQIACSQENNMPVRDDDTNLNRRVFFLDIMPVENGRPFPDAETAFIPKMCQQCGNPSCVSVCPAVATDIGDDGVVSQIWSRCFGCRYCIASCPYDARVFNWWKPEYPGTLARGLNPDVSIASRGTVVKCTFCSHRWKKERDRLLAQGILDVNAVEYTPACVAACPVKAFVFGDLNDLSSGVSKLAASSRAFRLMHAIDNKPEGERKKLQAIKKFPEPKVWYLSSKKWLRDLSTGGKK
jgi:molybdopterin-containing oxidoreductase family iron-sulfur binding subunit